MSTQQVGGCVGEWRNRGKGGSLCGARAVRCMCGCVGVSLGACTLRHCLIGVCILKTLVLGFGFLISHLEQLQVPSGGKERQKLQPLRNPLFPLCEGAAAGATPRTGPHPHPKSSWSLKKRVENAEVKGHFCSC